MRRLIPALVLLLPSFASADFAKPTPGEVAVRDVPGSNKHWQEARAIVDAPPETVKHWIGDIEYWPARFRDVKETRVLSRNGNKMRVVVKSSIMHELTLDVEVKEDGVFYSANDPHVKAWGRIFITPTADGRTDVIMQTAANVTGFIGMLAPKSIIRDRERDKLVSDLSDLTRLARSHRAARRPPPPARRPETP